MFLAFNPLVTSHTKGNTCSFAIERRSFPCNLWQYINPFLIGWLIEHLSNVTVLTVNKPGICV